MTNFLIKLFVKNNKNTTDPAVRERYGVFSSITGIVVNVLLAAMKLLIGFIAGSIAIIADAVNNFSDAIGRCMSCIDSHYINASVI